LDAVLCLSWLVTMSGTVISFDMSLFPFRLQDVSGYGVGLTVKDIYAAAFGERNFSSELMDLMVQNGRHGILLRLTLLIQYYFLYITEWHRTSNT
jgi:hypothetical protein